MNLAEFSNLDNASKMECVIGYLREAREIFAYIRDNCSLGISEITVAELDKIGDDFFEYSVMAAQGLFDDIFLDMRSKLWRLKELSEDIGGSLVN